MGGDDYNYMLFSGISLEDMPAYVALVVKAMATAINVRAYAYLSCREIFLFFLTIFLNIAFSLLLIIIFSFVLRTGSDISPATRTERYASRCESSW